MDYREGNQPFGLAMANLLDDHGAGNRPLTEAEKERRLFEKIDREYGAGMNKAQALHGDVNLKEILRGPGIG